MKRYLKIISIVSVLSLIVVVFAEVSWLRVNVDLKRNTTSELIGKILQEATAEITEVINRRTYFLNPGSRTKGKQIYDYSANDLSSLIISAAFFIDKFTIQDLLCRKFMAYGLSDTKYAYGIVRDDKMVLHSSIADEKQFLKLISQPQKDVYVYQSRLFYRNYVFTPKKNNPLHTEVLTIVFFDNIFDTLRKLPYTLTIIIVFTLVIITLFYLNISFILRQDKVDTMKTNFVNNMTHEFKTPISSIQLATTLSTVECAQNRPDKFNTYTQIILQETDRMLNLVESILHSASFARGEIRIDKTYVHLHELVLSSIKKHKIGGENTNIHIHTFFYAKNDLVLVDDVHITNAINNILDNCVKYAREGTPLDINISTYAKNHTILLQIKDNGIGIAKKDIKHIFDKFYRVDTGNLHKVKGFGLGLYYTQMIIKAHRGTIKAKSVLNQGTTMNIVLPVHTLSPTDSEGTHQA